MSTILFILPYFGKLPTYFQLYLNSCKANPDICWLIVTDNNMQQYSIPPNVMVRQMSFTSLQDMIANKFGTHILAPYELCNYKVAYHDLFEEANNYDFWGFCDCDLIWGNLRNFITDDVLNNFDKISWRGHMTLFRNDTKINNAYKIEIPGFKTFRGCIEGSEGINLFDEVGINKIFDHEGLSTYKKIPFADLKIRSANFKCLHNIFPEQSNGHAIFRWDENNGLELIYYTYNNEIKTQQAAYVHFLKRPMKVAGNNLSKSMLIVPNSFIDDRDITVPLIKKYSRNKIYWSYYIKRLNLRFLKSKIEYIVKHRNQKPDQYTVTSEQ